MKGKRKFTRIEAEQIRALIREKNKATPSQQKGIRNKIREKGFYYSDFSSTKEGYTTNDFDALIQSGQIEIIDENIQGEFRLKSQKFNGHRKKPRTSSSGSHDFSVSLTAFESNRFDPRFDSEMKITGQPGNYIVCLRDGSVLPSIEIAPKMRKFAGLSIIYTGIASKNLRTRDFRQHFTGNNAGRSTLRKSIGSLMGLKKIPRDKDPTTGKTKFEESDEIKLTQWMLANLILFFFANNDFRKIEEELIEHFNPPLNLQGNKNNINSDFRSLLSRIRSISYR